MVNLLAEIALLSRISDFNSKICNVIREWLDKAEVHVLAHRHRENLQKRHVDLGFNLFALISDVYHRENFHSDILKALIDPKGAHGEKEKFLRVFIRFLQKQGVHVVPKNYWNPRVVREEGRIDLLIADDVSKRAIIVENKINNAGDMHRQIPRYLAYVHLAGYQCDAIIYLRLHGHSGPDTTDWTAEEWSEAKKLIHVISAYDETENDLFNGWIRKCEAKSENSDATLILRQYGALIKKLGGNVMNRSVMDAFYKIILEGNNFETALSLKAMVDDLVLFRVERIIDHFKHNLSPFTKVANWNDNNAYFTGAKWEEAHLGIDIGVQEQSYSFIFWDRNDDTGKNGRAKAILQKMGILDQYVFEQGGFRKVFAFPSEETALLDHVTEFKKMLHDALASIGSKGGG